MNHVVIRDQIELEAPAGQIWEAISNPATHAAWHPFVEHIAGEHALGALRQCDVVVGRKPGRTEERCTVYDHERRISWAIDVDSSGFSNMVSEWSAGFSLEPLGPRATRVTAESAFYVQNFLLRLGLPLIRRRFHRVQREILAGLEGHITGSTP